MLGLDVGLRGEVPAVMRASSVAVWAVRSLLVAMVAAGAGCIPSYRPPSLAEPHATVKVHLAYHVRPGPDLTQLVLLNGEQVGVPQPPNGGAGETGQAVAVRPGPTRWDVRTMFSHTDTVPQTQTTTTFQTVPCGDSVCTTPVTETQTVWVNQDVTDAACERIIQQAPQAGGVYLLQYDFYATGRCTLACLRQWPQPDGTFQNGPCEPAPPSQTPPISTGAEPERRPAIGGGLDVN